jgi:hypothetical protein
MSSISVVLTDDRELRGDGSGDILTIQMRSDAGVARAAPRGIRESGHGPRSASSCRASGDRVAPCMYSELDEINSALPQGLKLQKPPQAELYGTHSLFDSMGLVRLMLAVEEKVEYELGVAVTLADHRAMSGYASPFATIGSPTASIKRRLVNTGAGTD